MRHVSKWFRHSGTTRAALIAAVFAVVGVVALMPVIANPRIEPREIVLVARDMAFYVDGSGVPNPTIAVRRGEDIRLVVRNDDPGITHGFALTAADASLDEIRAGSSASVVFHAPTELGRFDYLCPPHAQMMRGTILVTD